jgi:hypothetical protein
MASLNTRPGITPQASYAEGAGAHANLSAMQDTQPPPPPPPFPPPQPRPLRPPIDRSAVRPGIWEYWLAGAIFAVTVGLVIAGVIFVVDRVPGDVHRFTAPGSVTQRLQRGSARTIYVHVPTPHDPDTVASATAGIPDPSCRVLGPAEETVPVKQTSGTSLSAGADAYAARLEFTAARAGIHVVSCRPGGESRQPVVLGIGPKEHIVGFVGGIFGTIAVAFLGTAAAIAAGVLTGFLRHRSRRRLEQAAQAGTPYRA